ncbi:hypothetical protein B0J11DRAFT_585728 [Dendryphion nanum]|uniref:DUF7924 domain-containing protein n=1 Tax=Dendryphion nanum TaxID=256645 RepID=A0A9P9D3J9_9PLEO|nr:hypothetical protein B0J11DRAFT_585728 [Dendryphion nanum]
MSESSRLRDLKTQQRRPRSCSPTKKSPQYRNTILKPANILVDTIRVLPPDIEALLPCGLRELLDLNPPIRPPPTRMPKSIRRTFSANCSDKIWRASLKPPAPKFMFSLPSSTWPVLPLNPTARKDPRDSSSTSTHNSLDPDLIRVPPDGNPFDFTAPPLSTEPSEPSTANELEGTLTAPKQDIMVGISREAFSSIHAGLLVYWQDGQAVLSDPYATQGDMRFPFLIIEAKGIATNGNLFGAQNQAAGGGACAIRPLQDVAAPRSEQNRGSFTP